MTSTSIPAAIAWLVLALAAATPCRAAADDPFEEASGPAGRATFPAGVRIVRDIPYGSAPRQHFDVYAPAVARNAPVVLMIHGGGWRIGDKAHRPVVENKVGRWVPKGLVFVSANYRMVPQADPLEQARDVARALAEVQRRAAEWGGDGRKVVLMGHSAGAHLAALLAASPGLAAGQGAAPWLGTVLLDSGALDVPEIMTSRHLRLYDPAFGSDQAFWQAVSPLHQLAGTGAPVLAVCSSRRLDSCPQARRFAARGAGLGRQTEVLEQDLSHGEINQRLGEDGPYTAAVEAFLAGLDPHLDRLLAAPR